MKLIKWAVRIVILLALVWFIQTAATVQSGSSAAGSTAGSWLSGFKQAATTFAGTVSEKASDVTDSAESMLSGVKQSAEDQTTQSDAAAAQ